MTILNKQVPKGLLKNFLFLKNPFFFLADIHKRLFQPLLQSEKKKKHRTRQVISHFMGSWGGHIIRAIKIVAQHSKQLSIRKPKNIKNKRKCNRKSWHSILCLTWSFWQRGRGKKSQSVTLLYFYEIIFTVTYSRVYMLFWKEYTGTNFEFVYIDITCLTTTISCKSLNFC